MSFWYTKKKDWFSSDGRTVKPHNLEENPECGIKPRKVATDQKEKKKRRQNERGWAVVRKEKARWVDTGDKDIFRPETPGPPTSWRGGWVRNQHGRGMSSARDGKNRVTQVLDRDPGCEWAGGSATVDPWSLYQ